MPELPEVETILCGIKPHIIEQDIINIVIRRANLRWPITKGIKTTLQGETVRAVKRRAKYLLLEFDCGTLIIHLGMSGNLRVLTSAIRPKKHDHIDIHFANNKCLRFTDPRRFGAFLFTPAAKTHPLLADIGPEPLTAEFDGKYLFAISRNRKMPIKSFIMDSKIVAGVGNIYAAESLFIAGIHPLLPAGELDLSRAKQLAKAIKQVLQNAIHKGGTTLKDFTTADGNQGYFQIELQAYGRDGQPCVKCGTILEHIRLAQRSTVFCPQCQHL